MASTVLADEALFYGIKAWQRESFEAISSVDMAAAELDAGWQRKALDEVQEKPQWRERDIDALRDIIRNSKELSSPVSDAFLLRFLRAQKFDYELAFAMLRRYFLMRRTYASNFVSATPNLAVPILEHGQQSLLETRDASGRRIFLFRAGKWEPRLVRPADIFAANLMLLELVAAEPKSQVAGIVMVVDMAGFGFRHLVHLTKDYVKAIASILQATFPLRFREIHIVNESYMFDLAFALIKPFLSDIIRSRIHCHGSNLRRFHGLVSPEVLPKEFGGQAGPMTNAHLIQPILASQQYFDELKTFGFIDPNAELEQPHPFQNYCMMATLEGSQS